MSNIGTPLDTLITSKTKEVTDLLNNGTYGLNAIRTLANNAAINALNAYNLANNGTNGLVAIKNAINTVNNNVAGGKRGAYKRTLITINATTGTYTVPAGASAIRLYDGYGMYNGTSNLTALVTVTIGGTKAIEKQNVGYYSYGGSTSTYIVNEILIGDVLGIDGTTSQLKGIGYSKNISVNRNQSSFAINNFAVYSGDSIFQYINPYVYNWFIPISAPILDAVVFTLEKHTQNYGLPKLNLEYYV